jgi:hypothetical protein
MFLVDYVKATFGKDLNPNSWDCAEDVCRLKLVTTIQIIRQGMRASTK